MTAVPVVPVGVVPIANTWTQLGLAVTASHVEGSSVRVANIGSVAANAKIRATNGTLVANRGGIYPVPFGTSDSIVQLEDKTPLPAGWYWEIWSSVAATLEFTRTGWLDDA